MSVSTNLHAVSRSRLGRVALSLIILALSLVVFLLVFSPGSGLRPAWAQTNTFIFTFAGDFGTGSPFTANLQKMAQSGAVFDLAVGDLSYGGSPSSWCTSVKNVVGSTFPFEVLVGNHDDDGDSAHINNFTPCLPDRMGSSGVYGSEYYFDYNNARVIMVAAGLTVNGVGYNYNSAGTHQTWLIDRIREAKAAGKWVIVGNHLNCIDTATKPCEAGVGFTNVIHNEHVDLLIQGHDHTYQRTKQLSCIASGSYNAACVADSDDSLVKGAGTVTIINGLGGQGQYNINASDIEHNYFVKAMGGNGWWDFRASTTGGGHEYGIVKITVSPTQLDEVWVPSQVVAAGFPGDSFSIIGGPTPTPCTTCPTNTPTSTPLPTVNVVANSSFEVADVGGAGDAANWTEWASQVRASDKFRTGAWSLKSTVTTAGNTFQDVSVVPNSTYTYSGYAWKTNTVGNACIDMADIVGEVQQCTTAAGSWVQLSGTWNSGSATTVRLRVYVDGNPTGAIWFDDITLTGPGTGPTNTPLPPTNTNTAAPPTNTFTPAPPTNTFTPAPPTNTPTNTLTPAPATNTNTPAPNGNVIANSSFEIAGTGGAADAESWTEWPNQVRASDKFNTGSWSLKSTVTTNGATTQGVSVVANTAYTFSGYAWKTNTVGNACIDMADLAGEVQKCTTAAGSWVFLTGPWNSGTNTAITVRAYVDGNPTGAIWFDDISLTGPIGGPTSTPTNTTVAPTNTPTNTSAPPTATNTPVPSGNVVQNSSFETAGAGGAADAANWTEGTNHARASDKFNTGAWSLKSTYRSTGTDTRQTVSITANHTYTYSGYIWRTNTVGGSCLDMNDLAGELTLCATAAGSWQFKTGTWNSGTNTSVTLRAITDASPTGDIWFDDITLQ